MISNAATVSTAASTSNRFVLVHHGTACSVHLVRPGPCINMYEIHPPPPPPSRKNAHMLDVGSDSARDRGNRRCSISVVHLERQNARSRKEKRRTNLKVEDLSYCEYTRPDRLTLSFTIFDFFFGPSGRSVGACRVMIGGLRAQQPREVRRHHARDSDERQDDPYAGVGRAPHRRRPCRGDRLDEQTFRPRRGRLAKVAQEDSRRPSRR